MLKEEIIDYAIEDFLYVLTTRNIYSIDTTSFRIIDQTPLPQKFNYITIGQDDIFLISPSEIIILNKRNLSFKNGIGIEPGDYQPMIPPALLPNMNLIYLINTDEKRSIIRVIDYKKGRKVKNGSFFGIKKFYYIPEERIFVILTNSGIYLLDLNLKMSKKIKFNFPAEDFFIYKGNFVITNKQGIFCIDKDGKVIDFQPVLFDTPLQNQQFYFFNPEYLISIDPLTFRIKRIIKNEEKVNKIYPVDDECSLGINKKGDLFLLDKYGRITRLIREEYGELKPSELRETHGDSLFYLQFGAFSDINLAKNFSDSIKSMGFPVFIDSSMNDLYRIKLGGFMEKKLAQEIVERINLPCWLVFHKKFDCLPDTIFNFCQEIYHLKNGIIKKGVNDEKNN